MVKKGRFGLQLVDAATPEVSFKEHTAEDGATYIEVEPDAEYFLKVGISSDFKNVAYDIEVDGEDLGYNSKHHSCEEKIKGLRSREQGESTHKSLKFRGLYDLHDQTKEKTTVSPNDSNGDWIGEIVVTFVEVIELEGYHNRKDATKSKWSGSHKSINCNKKKLVKSGKGTTTKISTASRRMKRRNWKKGKIIETITVKYCTTVGLINIGVLPKPPYWKMARANFPDAALIKKKKIGRT